MNLTVSLEFFAAFSKGGYIFATSDHLKVARFSFLKTSYLFWAFPYFPNGSPAIPPSPVKIYK